MRVEGKGRSGRGKRDRGIWLEVMGDGGYEEGWWTVGI